MGKIKVIWLSNIVQSDEDIKGTGTWLQAMAQGLINSDQVEIGNIAWGKVAQPVRRDSGQIRQWIVPIAARLTGNGLPSNRLVAEIAKIVDEFSPDLVQIWGTENYWGLLTARNLIRGPALLVMQGVRLVCARVYNGGLSFWEQMSCIGVKEIIRKSTIFQGRRRFAKWGILEREIIENHSFISTQSEWMAAWVRSINESCLIFHSDLPLRGSFCNAAPWEFSGNPVFFCSASYAHPYKGLHVAVRAIAILKRDFPDVRLHIAGIHQRTGIRRDGYVDWLNREVERLGVKPNVVWLGALNDSEIVEEMRSAAGMVLPTYIESYCLAMVESMMVGIPSVVSYVGALPFNAVDERSALFFAPGDEAMCAYHLRRLLTDRALAERISQGAREIALVRNNTNRIIRDQIGIYHQVLSHV